MTAAGRKVSAKGGCSNSRQWRHKGDSHMCHSTLPVGTREVNKAAPFRNSSEHETIAVAADAL